MQAKAYEHMQRRFLFQIILPLLGRINLLRAAFRIYETVKMADFRSLRHNVRYWGKTAPDGLPIPPSKLRVLVAGTSDIPGFLNFGKLGAESIRGALEKNGGGPPCFWEIYNGDDITGAALLRLTDRPENYTVLKSGFFRTVKYSYAKNIDQVVTKVRDGLRKCVLTSAMALLITCMPLLLRQICLSF